MQKQRLIPNKKHVSLLILLIVIALVFQNFIPVYAASNDWALTGSMNTGREYHTATLLPNGKVLVAGGGVVTAELYDPATET